MTGGGFLAGAITAKLVLDKSGWNSSVQSVVKDGQKLTGMSGSVASGFKTAGSIMMVAGGAIVGALMSCVKEAGEADRTIRQLNTVLASTKGVAGITATEAIKLSEALQKDSSYSHDLILEGENLLLTFTKIGKDTFPEATKVMLDMSVALGQDLKGSAIQLGKALQDPVMGVTALRRVGVNFTKEQRELIKVLVESGHSLDAQKIILKELSTEFGGSALATTKGFGGQCKQLKMDLDDVREEIGRAVLPILKDLIETVRPIIQHILTWIEQNPKLVEQFAGLAMKGGLLLLVLGPISYMIPKIVGLFGSLIGGGKSLVGAFGSLNKPLSTSGNLLGKLALVGAAAFVGWKIGKLIGEVTGLNGVLEGAFEKAFKLLGIIKDHNIEMGKGHAAAYAKQQEAIGLASELSHTKVKTYREALDLLEITFKKTGTTGSASLDALVKGHVAAELSAGKHKETQSGLHGVSKEAEDDGYGLARSLSAQQEAQKALTEYLSSTGIPTAKERNTEITNALTAQKNLDEALKAGLISHEKYQEVMKDLNQKLKDYGYTAKVILGPSRDFSDLMKNMAPKFEQAHYWGEQYDQVLKDLGLKSISAAKEETRGYLQQQKLLNEAWKQGMVSNVDYATGMTDLQDKIRGTADAHKEVIPEIKSGWEGLYSDIAKGWGDVVSQALKNDWGLRGFLRGVWGEMKETFFTYTGEMISRWAVDFLDSVFKQGTKLAAKAAADSISGVGDSVKGLTGTAAGAASSIGTALGSLGTGLATVITAITSAVATGIVALATGIASAIVALATGIAAAATILAAAAVPLLIVGAIAIAIFAGFKAIESLFGGGGGKQTDVTYWLKMMHADGKELHDFVLGDFRSGYMNSIVSDLIYSKSKLEDISRGIWDSKDFLGPMLSALQSIDTNLANLPHGAAGALIEQPTLMVAGENAPSVSEVLLPIPGLKAALGAAAVGGGGAGATQIVMSATFNVNCLESEDMREVVRKKIGPEFIEWIRGNFGKRELQEALGV